ncbi:hypothetical protein NP493_178g02016 [Ridgeia piscesae]|uniref:Uncharacterized protein n=1 Tax=Ridgeia piscesae TaxID=27915 RepID=A0AAD9UF09_RIDPI|nr:hypothetical protein NP493_178g02016 [Ridgeia piscesae]
MRSKPQRRSGGNDDSTDDSDEHLLIPDIPLQHLFERMTSTEITCSDVKSPPDGSSNSSYTNTLTVDRTTQTDSSAIHIRTLSNDALTYRCGVILNPDLDWTPAKTFEEKIRPNGVVLSGVDSTRHLVEFVCDDVDETLPWDVYHEDTVLQVARAGHLQLLRDLISTDATRQSDVCDVEGNTALHLACGNGNIDCVRFLWEACPHLTVRTNHARLTPAMMAVKVNLQLPGLLRMIL